MAVLLISDRGFDCEYTSTMTAARRRHQRQRGQIRQRGSSFQVTVNAGLDPLTGKRMYLTTPLAPRLRPGRS